MKDIEFDCQVSIQLVSPTSGELVIILDKCCPKRFSFHSISFPNEWGDLFGYRSLSLYCRPPCFHSISFPNEWGVDAFITAALVWISQNPVSIQLVSPPSGDPNLNTRYIRRGLICFHSISFPSEWGHD